MFSRTILKYIKHYDNYSSQDNVNLQDYCSCRVRVLTSNIGKNSFKKTLDNDRKRIAFRLTKKSRDPSS